MATTVSAKASSTSTRSRLALMISACCSRVSERAEAVVPTGNLPRM
jgi:hypothetical protein